jgi:hypothetical protein
LVRPRLRLFAIAGMRPQAGDIEWATVPGVAERYLTNSGALKVCQTDGSPHQAYLQLQVTGRFAGNRKLMRLEL